jgi:hypothetical protein
MEWNKIEHSGMEGNRAKGLVAMGIDGISYLSNKVSNLETVARQVARATGCPGNCC